MKEIVRRIFGDEEAEDPDIVDFYERVGAAAMKQHAIEFYRYFTGNLTDDIYLDYELFLKRLLSKKRP